VIIKSSLGLSFGVVFSVLLFKRRAWPAWIGLGFGAGRAWEEADGMFMLMFIECLTLGKLLVKAGATACCEIYYLELEQALASLFPQHGACKLAVAGYLLSPELSSDFRHHSCEYT
jgi:hypothetical protein